MADLNITPNVQTLSGEGTIELVYEANGFNAETTGSNVVNLSLFFNEEEVLLSPEQNGGQPVPLSIEGSDAQLNLVNGAIFELGTGDTVAPDENNGDGSEETTQVRNLLITDIPVQFEEEERTLLEIPIEVTEEFDGSAVNFAVDPPEALNLEETPQIEGVTLQSEEQETPTVELSIEPASGSEEEETAFTLTATASAAVEGEQSVDLALDGDADAEDFSNDLPSEITIADGQTTGSVEVTVNDDDEVEGEETATFTISEPSDGLTLGQSLEASATIADNDEQQETPTVELSIEPASGSEEEETTFTLTATASAAVNGEQTVDLALSGDADAEDFSNDLPSEITIADGQTTGSVEVTVNDDNEVEGEETATFTISEPSDGLALGETLQASAAIADNDEEEEDEADVGLNALILNGTDQQLTVGFDVDIRGTSAAETLLVKDNTNVIFTPQSGDRVDVSQNLADYNIERSGLTELTLTDSNGDTITLTINQDESFQLRFADGNTTVNLNQEGVTIGDEVLATGEQADVDNINLGNQVSQVGEDGNDALAQLPNQGGPDEVTAGTANSDNIDGDQDGQTLSGKAGIDRFIFDNLVDDQDSPVQQSITIDDFTAGEQVFFEGGFDEGDLTVANPEINGKIRLGILNTEVTISEVSEEKEDDIIGLSSFKEVFGEEAIAFA